ncbi:hypothetical protein AKO1_013054 [Acrasis kona]|uniref:Uncharacterized protein n=1 Tax=Acrasis kona TaxID=1008807 RepID=A0AAW2Z0C9_9EUKA
MIKQTAFVFLLFIVQIALSYEHYGLVDGEVPKACPFHAQLNKQRKEEAERLKQIVPNYEDKSSLKCSKTAPSTTICNILTEKGTEDYQIELNTTIGMNANFKNNTLNAIIRFDDDEPFFDRFIPIEQKIEPQCWKLSNVEGCVRFDNNEITEDCLVTVVSMTLSTNGVDIELMSPKKLSFGCL